MLSRKYDELKTRLTCWCFAVVFFWSPTCLTTARKKWLTFLSFFLLLLLFTLGNICLVRWATEYLHACLVLAHKESIPVDTELSYSVKLLRLTIILWWALNPPSSQQVSLPKLRQCLWCHHLAGAAEDAARSSQRSQRQCFLVACLVSTLLGPKDPSPCTSWVSQQLIPLLPRCSADSGDLLNQMLFAYWAALYAFCFAETKCFSSPKSYLNHWKERTTEIQDTWGFFSNGETKY